MIEITFSPLFQKERAATRFKFGDKVRICGGDPQFCRGLRDTDAIVTRVYLPEAYAVAIKGCLLLANVGELNLAQNSGG